MVRGTGVDEPYVFRIGGTNRSRGRHRIFSMSHHEHSPMAFIVGVGGVIRELSACGSRLTLLLSILFFVVDDFVAVSVFDLLLSAWTNMEAPPSSEHSSIVSTFLPKLGIVFIGHTSSASSLAKAASCSAASSSSEALLLIQTWFSSTNNMD